MASVGYLFRTLTTLEHRIKDIVSDSAVHVYSKKLDTEAESMFQRSLAFDAVTASFSSQCVGKKDVCIFSWLTTSFSQNISKTYSVKEMNSGHSIHA